jgi:hypothetical protein
MIPIHVVNRKGIENDKQSSVKTKQITHHEFNSLSDVSSTYVKKLLAVPFTFDFNVYENNLKLLKLCLHPHVLNYILRNDLYGSYYLGYYQYLTSLISS